MSVQISMYWWRRVFSWHHTNSNTCRPMRDSALALGERCRRRWVSRGEGQVPPVLCCTEFDSAVLTSGGIPAMWVLRAARPSHLDSWTLPLCEPSQIITPAAASQSSFYTSGRELMLSEQRLTQGNLWHNTSAVRGFKPVTCQICEAPSSQCQTTLLPTQILSSQNWSKLNIKI